jgi:hypothetical protein
VRLPLNLKNPMLKTKNGRNCLVGWTMNSSAQGVSTQWQKKNQTSEDKWNFESKLSNLAKWAIGNWSLVETVFFGQEKVHRCSKTDYETHTWIHAEAKRGILSNELLKKRKRKINKDDVSKTRGYTVWASILSNSNKKKEKNGFVIELKANCEMEDAEVLWRLGILRYKRKKQRIKTY